MRPSVRRVGRVDHHGVLDLGAQDRDLTFEQSLLVLGGVVLEVLGQVSMAAGHRDRIHDLGALGPFQLGQLGLEPGHLFRGELDVIH